MLPFVRVSARSARPEHTAQPDPLALLHVSAIDLDIRTDFCCEFWRNPQSSCTTCENGSCALCGRARQDAAEHRVAGVGAYRPIHPADVQNRLWPLSKVPKKTGHVSSMHGCFTTFCSPHSHPSACRRITYSRRHKHGLHQVLCQDHMPLARGCGPSLRCERTQHQRPGARMASCVPYHEAFRRPSVFHVISGRSLDGPCRRVLGALHSPVF
jgi:hypothetical protein